VKPSGDLTLSPVISSPSSSWRGGGAWEWRQDKPNRERQPSRGRLGVARKGNQNCEMNALDDTLLEKVEGLVDASRQPLRWTSSTTVVIAQLVERIDALEAALREIADAVTAAGAMDAEYVPTERRSSDHLSESIS
jgi:hypothetical protein